MHHLADNLPRRPRGPPYPQFCKVLNIAWPEEAFGIIHKASKGRKSMDFGQAIIQKI